MGAALSTGGCLPAAVPSPQGAMPWTKDDLPPCFLMCEVSITTHLYAGGIIHGHAQGLRQRRCCTLSAQQSLVILVIILLYSGYPDGWVSPGKALSGESIAKEMHHKWQFPVHSPSDFGKGETCESAQSHCIPHARP